MDKTAIRNASTIILVREPGANAHVLMGQRGKTAAFMPNKFVFPGGAVDKQDETIRLCDDLPSLCARRLLEKNSQIGANALATAAIRELWEEAGLIFGEKADWSEDVPEDWSTFARQGFRPSARHLNYVFRAITPPGRPRRFDARFFLADAQNLANDPDDFSAATDELSHLQWIPLKDARKFDLPFITEVVLAEIAGQLPHIGAPETVPFFDNTQEESLFLRLGGASPLD